MYARALLLLLCGAALFMLRPSIHGNDGVQYYSYLRSAWFDHDLDFTNEYEHYFAQESRWFNGEPVPRDPVTHRPINLYGVGNALMWTPWFVVFHVGGELANAAGAHFQLDGYSRLYEIAVSLGSCVYASAGVWLLFSLLRRIARAASAFWAVLVVWLASPLVFYMYLHPSMSHANSLFLVSALLFVYFTRDTRLSWALCGVLYGLLVLVRYQDAVVALALILGEVLQVRRYLTNEGREVAPFSWRTRSARYGMFVLAAAFAFSPQLIAWKALHGSAFSGPRGYMMQGGVDLWHPRAVLKVLCSSKHGIFYWHPALLGCVAGLLLRSRYPRLQVICLVVFAAELWIVASWGIWWAGASFGHRMFVSVLPFFAVGACLLLEKLAELPRISWVCRIGPAIIVVAICWNFGYMVQYGAGWISRQEGVPLSELARNNLVRLPAALGRRVFCR